MRISREQDRMRNKTSHEMQLICIVYVKQKGMTKSPMDPRTDKVSTSLHNLHRWCTKVFFLGSVHRPRMFKRVSNIHQQ